MTYTATHRLLADTTPRRRRRARWPTLGWLRLAAPRLAGDAQPRRWGAPRICRRAPLRPAARHLFAAFRRRPRRAGLRRYRLAGLRLATGRRSSSTPPPAAAARWAAAVRRRPGVPGARYYRRDFGDDELYAGLAAAPPTPSTPASSSSSAATAACAATRCATRRAMRGPSSPSSNASSPTGTRSAWYASVGGVLRRRPRLGRSARTSARHPPGRRHRPPPRPHPHRPRQRRPPRPRLPPRRPR